MIKRVTNGAGWINGEDGQKGDVTASDYLEGGVLLLVVTTKPDRSARVV